MESLDEFEFTSNKFVIEFDHAINLVPRSMSESILTYLVPKAKTLCFEFSRNKQYYLRGSRAFNWLVTMEDFITHRINIEESN